MIPAPVIGLAAAREAEWIAAVSRDSIEQGLGWRWTPHRIRKAMADPAINVAVARARNVPVGFALMHYKDDEAHLLLFAVDAERRRAGVGSALLRWLEDAALVAGIGVVYVEARARNEPGRAFYGRHGYREIALVRGMYARGGHVEDGVRFAKDLWA